MRVQEHFSRTLSARRGIQSIRRFSETLIGPRVVIRRTVSISEELCRIF